LKAAGHLRISSDPSARSVYINPDSDPVSAKLAYEKRVRRHQQRRQQQQHHDDRVDGTLGLMPRLDQSLIPVQLETERKKILMIAAGHNHLLVTSASKQLFSIGALSPLYI